MEKDYRIGIESGEIYHKDERVNRVRVFGETPKNGQGVEQRMLHKDARDKKVKGVRIF